MRYIALLVFGVLAGSTMGLDSALAAWKRQNSSVCYPATIADYATYQPSGGLTNTTASSRMYICPFNEDSNVERTPVTTLNLHGFHQTGGGNSFASLCVKSWTTAGGINAGFFCSSASAVSAAGDFVLSPNRSTWNSGTFVGHFGYVSVVLTPGSQLYGVFSHYSTAAATNTTGFRQLHASGCYPADPNTGYGDYFDSSGIVNNNVGGAGGGFRKFICPLSEDWQIRRTSFTSLTVHGLQSPNGVTAISDCQKWWGTQGFTCGSSIFAAAGNSNYTAGLSRSSLNLGPWPSNEADFGYLTVDIPTGGGLYGYRVAF
ncbi:MAG: hypothetical protein Q8K32_12245 [Archangium sp.]|nr:hypothetical protein [Archangium sp.]